MANHNKISVRHTPVPTRQALGRTPVKSHSGRASAAKVQTAFVVPLETDIASCGT
jgi:hypothetical protein